MVFQTAKAKPESAFFFIDVDESRHRFIRLMLRGRYTKSTAGFMRVLNPCEEFG